MKYRNTNKELLVKCPHCGRYLDSYTNKKGETKFKCWCCGYFNSNDLFNHYRKKG